MIKMKFQRLRRPLYKLLFLNIILYTICFNNILANAENITVNGDTTTDIQIAINQASPGDTVFIPTGKYKYTEEIIVNTSDLLIQGVGVDYNDPANGTYLYTDLYGYDSKIMEINADNLRITGIAFRGATLPAYGTRPGGSAKYWVSNGIWVNNVKNLRIDHNYFTSFGAAAIETSTAVNDILIDHNWIIGNYLEGMGYGVNIGMSKIFIEDNYFQDNRHDIAAGNNGHYIARYNYFYNTNASSFASNLDAHRGTAKVEIYNNYIKHENPNIEKGSAVLMRGVVTDGIIFNNTFENTHSGVRLIYYEYEGGDMPNDEYWIWNNNYINVCYEIKKENDSFIIFNTPMPNYSPDPYPHPLNDDPTHPEFERISTKRIPKTTTWLDALIDFIKEFLSKLGL